MQILQDMEWSKFNYKKETKNKIITERNLASTCLVIHWVQRIFSLKQNFNPKLIGVKIAICFSKEIRVKIPMPIYVGLLDEVIKIDELRNKNEFPSLKIIDG